MAPGVVLAGTLQGSTVTSEFEGGPFADATVTSNGEEIAASNKVAASLSELGLLVDWYPDPSAGWHAGISGGLGVTGLVHQADDSTEFGIGAAGSLFGGYDWHIGPQWSLGIAIVASGNTTARMKDNEGDETGYELRAFSVGVAGSFLYF